MKKLLFLSIAVLFVLKLGAQNTTWCPPGAVWFFHYSNAYDWSLVKNGTLKLEYVGDEVKNGINCKKIVGTFNGCISCSYWSTVITNTIIPDFRTYYTYENNHVVYLYNGSTFDTVVNFNATIGDKWLRPSNCGDVLTVTDTGHVSVYGQNFKRIKTSHTYTFTQYQDPFNTTSPSTVIVSDNGATFTEHIFSTSSTPNDELFATSCYQWRPQGIADEMPEQTAIFMCYRDNYTNFSACDVGIKENYLNKINLSVYPNPASRAIIVDLPRSKVYSIKLTNVLSVVCKEISLAEETTEMDISQFKAGIYFLQVFEKGNLVAVQKIVKE